MNKVAEYIKYRLNAKKRHGIHSPFVYELSDKGLTSELTKDEKQVINAFIKNLKGNNESIEVTDHGSGSKKLSNKRRVKDIYRVSSSKGRYGHLLFKLSRHFKPMQILELGTSLGVGTTYMKLGSPEAAIFTIEGCPETAQIARKNFNKTGLKEIHSLVGTFKEVIPVLGAVKFDMIFIDGHHSGVATLEYLQMLESHISDNTILIFDDIRWSDDMLSAWNHIVKTSGYHVTIDLFRMGIAVKRPQQEKEHFTLRF